MKKQITRYKLLMTGRLNVCVLPENCLVRTIKLDLILDLIRQYAR